MKFLIAACLLGLAIAAPQGPPPKARDDVNPNNFFRTLRDDRTPVIGAIFKYLYETDNQIFAEKEGTEGSAGQSNMVGSYKFQTPEGETVEVRYTADENGYRPEGDIPALPAHVPELLRIAEQQRAEGIKFDERGFRI